MTLVLRRVCVFAGSNPGARADYRAAAAAFGRILADEGIALVYGGGRVGVMGAVANGALAAGGEVTGIIPEHLVTREIAHDGLPDLRVVRSMHQRKALMADMADAFVAMPGGLGTLEETFEVLTWTQLGLHAKPTALFNVAAYFDPLVAFLDHATAEGFITREHRGLIVTEDDAPALLERLRTFEMPPVESWLDPGRT